VKRWERAAKRALDVTGAVVGLTLSAPVIGIAAALIKREDGGPVFFRQQRVGLHGEPFEVLKLRTMVVNAEAQGAGFAVDAGDSRILKIGDLLRKTSIDELPQFWNILCGEMSLVGPRPTLQYQVDQYTPHQAHRLDVTPGVTGWAQIHGRASLPWADRIELDVWYVEHQSLRLDLSIMLRTIGTIFSRGGTYRGTSGGWRTPPEDGASL
jgi:lipopolysaccharide/colanic/teichoic acid biosynthesis glycosyltransferase